MKPSQIKKKYPKAWAEFLFKHFDKNEDVVLKSDVREWYASIVDHSNRRNRRTCKVIRNTRKTIKT